ncbi:MAG: TonB family protein [Verrucomicrobiae bacterium]|nr:TonB family protein [Verrucomicrobiae bacterium]
MNTYFPFLILSLSFHLGVAGLVGGWGGWFHQKERMPMASVAGNSHPSTLVLVGASRPSSPSRQHKARPSGEKSSPNESLVRSEDMIVHPSDIAESHGSAGDEANPDARLLSPRRSLRRSAGLRHAEVASSTQAGRHPPQRIPRNDTEEEHESPSETGAVSEKSPPGASASLPGNSGTHAETGSHGIFDAYLAHIRTRIEKYKQYPSISRRIGEEGVMVFKLRLDASGRIRDLELAERQASERLLEAGRRAVEKAAPFHPPPSDWDWQRTIRVPIRFQTM